MLSQKHPIQEFTDTAKMCQFMMFILFYKKYRRKKTMRSVARGFDGVLA